MGSTAFAHAAAIESSLAITAARVGDPTPLVYARLFAQHPEMHALFCQDRNDAVKGEMLSRVFDAILDFISDRHYADTLIRSEGIAHDSYGVPPAVFSTFFTVIAETIREVLGADWTSETDTAWRELLAAIAAATAPHP